MIIKTENLDGRDYNVRIQQLGEKVRLGLISQKEFSVALTRAEAKQLPTHCCWQLTESTPSSLR